MIRYWPDWVSNWTNSPFLSVLVDSLAVPPICSIVMVTPASGCCLASTTLPLTIVDWANAAGASPSNKVINTAVTRAVKICVIGSRASIYECTSAREKSVIASGFWVTGAGGNESRNRRP